MKVLILTFSNGKVNENSFIPNKKGLTEACKDECIKGLVENNYAYEHICVNKLNIRACLACGPRGWGKCGDAYECAIKDDFNKLYYQMSEYDAYIFITPVFFHEMSESAKTFFDKLKRCDAFNEQSKIRGKKVIAIACAGGSGTGCDNTLKAFEILSYFLKTKLIKKIDVTKTNFNEQKKLIIRSMNFKGEIDE